MVMNKLQMCLAFIVALGLIHVVVATPRLHISNSHLKYRTMSVNAANF